MKLRFAKLSPSSNTTVLVTDYVSTENYVQVANKIMSYTHLNAEQVGFIKEPNDIESKIRIEMPGGELCGDGLMSAAVLARWMGYSNDYEFKLESSGLKLPVKCRVEKIGSYMYRAKVSMPVEHEINSYETICDEHKISGKLVSLPGISHLILESALNQYSQENIIKLVKQVAMDINVSAVGIIPYININKGIKIEPCIHVPKIDKILFEQGCGSGTLALGFYLSQKHNKSINMNINQPGGIIKVEVNVFDSNENAMTEVKDAYLETDISITCKGEVYI